LNRKVLLYLLKLNRRIFSARRKATLHALKELSNQLFGHAFDETLATYYAATWPSPETCTAGWSPASACNVRAPSPRTKPAAPDPSIISL
jgi:hypothetical protein